MKKTYLFTIVLFFASLYANAQYPLVHDFNSDFKNGLPSIFIFNENLDEIASYDSASIHSIYETKSGQIRMDVNKYSFPSIKSSTLTYLLQELTTSVSDVNETSIKQAYPNPAISIINLPYQIEPGETTEMKIYDMNGKLMKTISIGSHFNQIKLSTSGYKPGMYIYRYNDKSGKFLVK
jgi:hypothetical protein